MEIEDLLDAEKIFDKCDWSNRKDIGCFLQAFFA